MVVGFVAGGWVGSGHWGSDGGSRVIYNSSIYTLKLLLRAAKGIELPRQALGQLQAQSDSRPEGRG